MRKPLRLFLVLGGLILSVSVDSLAQTQVWSYQFKPDGVDLTGWDLWADGSGGCVVHAQTFFQPDLTNSNTWYYEDRILWLSARGKVLYDNPWSYTASKPTPITLLFVTQKAVGYDMAYPGGTNITAIAYKTGFNQVVYAHAFDPNQPYDKPRGPINDKTGFFVVRYASVTNAAEVVRFLYRGPSVN